MRASERDEKIWQFCQMVGALDKRWAVRHFIEGEQIYQETIEDTKKLVSEMLEWLSAQDITKYPKKSE